MNGWNDEAELHGQRAAQCLDAGEQLSALLHVDQADQGIADFE